MNKEAIMARSEDVKTPLGIFSFTADLFKAREQDGGKKKFGCTILFDKTADLSKLHEAALKAAREQWGDKADQWIKDGVVKTPFLDGDGPQGVNKKRGERNPGFAGRTFIRCSSGEDYKPKVFDRKMNPVGEAADFPSGSQGYGVVNFWTWEHPTNGKGISTSVSLVQVAKKAEGAEVLGGAGGPDEKDYFEKIEDEGGAPDSTKSGAGASGLFG
jgi:hypothetical protein